MKYVAAALLALLIAGAAQALDGDAGFRHRRNESRVAGDPSRFTGQVSIGSPFAAAAPGRVVTANVAFEPGARTNWHSHPLGQTLVVISGRGLTQCGDGPVVEIEAGDMVWCSPGLRHWHGATEDSAMTHLAIVEAEDGVTADWFDPVTEQEYKTLRSKGLIEDRR